MVMDSATVVGVFEDRAAADGAIYDLQRAGFGEAEIGFLARSDDPSGEVIENAKSTAEEGAGAGALIGGLLGAAALLIPGIGPVVAGGILAGVIGGAAVGAATGGLAGTLIGWGVPEDHAAYYHGELDRGRTLVTVRAAGRHLEATVILRARGARDIRDRGAEPAPEGSDRVA